MQFYRRLTAVKAISFDLDDTLYNNRPIMQAIEDKMVVYFTEKFASLFSGLSPDTEVGRTPEPHQIYNRHFWAPYREQAISANHELNHDVVILRFESYRLGFIAHNIEAADAVLQAQAAVDYFISLRSDFIVPKVSHELLASLSKKFPLVAISNGNVNTKTLGIDHYFQYIYHAGFQSNDGSTKSEHLLRQKPEVDMFTVVCQQLDILPEELLHVGDCGYADIHGALSAGCQTAWLPHYGVGKKLNQLPHIELSTVSQLLRLIV